MSFQIADIVLYGPIATPRVVPLRCGEVNIITGASKTGKSSLALIVDYCLGSSQCEVPDGPIRKTVRWYALRLEVANQQIFIARKAPEPEKGSSAEIYIDIGTRVEIPPAEALRGTTNVEGAEQVLNTMAGIVDNINEPPAGQTRAAAQADVRDGLVFCFQQQDQIINRKYLFHHQSDHWIAQKTKDVLPYFLGAMDDDHLIQQARLRALRRELRVATKQLRELEAIRGDGISRATRLLAEAVDLGVVDTVPDALEELQAIALLMQLHDLTLPPLPDGDVTDSGRERQRLFEQREQLSDRFRSVSNQLASVKKIMQDGAAYSGEAGEHIARLQSLELLAPADGTTAVCPMCSSSVEQLPTESQLRTAISQLSHKLNGVEMNVPHLQKYVNGLEEQHREIKAELTANSKAQLALQRADERVRQYRDHQARFAHLLGRVSLYLESIPEVGAEPSELAEKIDTLARQIKTLDEAFGDDALRARLDSFLALISADITQNGRALAIEYSDHHLRFDLRKLTVVADTPDGPVPMDRIGSGENWVGYHIAALLAFHGWFIKKNRPVPRFLFLDQPSQIGYPAEPSPDGSEPAEFDEDRVAVGRVMKFIHDWVAKTNPAFQVIITEHADLQEAWYQSAVVERWRKGEALIPQDWLDSNRHAQ